jgi:hypothetical protein
MSNGATLQPSVHPEQQAVAIAEHHLAGRLKEGYGRLIYRTGQSCPSTVRLSEHQPQPALLQRLSKYLGVQNSKAAQLRRMLHTPPRHQAFSTLDWIHARTKEALHDFLQRLVGPGGKPMQIARWVVTAERVDLWGPTFRSGSSIALSKQMVLPTKIAPVWNRRIRAVRFQESDGPVLSGPTATRGITGLRQGAFPLTKWRLDREEAWTTTILKVVVVAKRFNWRKEKKTRVKSIKSSNLIDWVDVDLQSDVIYV